MAGFGGAVKLTGESEYRQALAQITQNLREVSSQMNVVSSAYDKNDNSIEALASKSTVLNSKLEEQNNKLKVLQSQYTSMSQKYEENTNKHNALIEEYDKEKAELDKIKNTLGSTSKEYLAQEKVVAELEKEVKKSTANQNANAQSMSNLRIQMNNATTDINKTENEIKQLDKAMEEAEKSTDDLGNSIDDAGKKTKGANDGFTVMKGVLSNLATDVIRSAVNGLKQLSGALVNVGKQAVANYKEYQQLAGGVETLFGESADQVMKYSEIAYKTAGISANQYMEQITSFSASLISSLGGDTKKASEVGNRAIIDMSDNANKMGTSMEMIQNAYQGFAKQNYTMLDNLKLGYGGTKSEMQRLIADASKMTDVQKELGITVDGSSMSFANIVNAISVMQKSMGIAGTTTKEAGDTIEGSFNSMAGAWQNLLTGIASGSDISGLIDNLVNSIVTTAKNLIPTIQNTIKGVANLVSGLLKEVVPLLVKEIPPLIQETLPILIEAVQSSIKAIMDVLPIIIDTLADLIPQIIETLLTMLPQLVDVGIKGILSLIQGFSDALPQLIGMIPDIVIQIVDVLLDNIGLIIETGTQLLVGLINGLSIAIPQLIDYIPQIVETIIEVLMENLPLIIEAGIEIMVALINGLVQSLPSLIAYVPKIIVAIVKGLLEGVPKMISSGGDLIGGLIKGIANMIGNVGQVIGNVVKTIIDGIKNLPKQMFNWGKDMIQGLINGIKSMIGKVGEAVGNVANKIKSFLHFSRPDVGPLRDYETYMPDMIEGMTQSLEKASPRLIDQIKSLASDISTNITPSNEYMIAGSSNATGYNSLIEAFKEALSQMKIELDDEVAGRFVCDTVTKVIYT